MASYFYKSEAPTVVAIVQEYYQAKDVLHSQSDKLGQLFGGAIAPMRDIDSHYAGGVKLSADRALDVHWRRPDDYGYRSLRCNAVPPKGISKEERAAIREEHDRLLALWKDNCPPRLYIHDYWERLSINTGNILICGGIMFEHQDVAYFQLGFQIDKSDHEKQVADGKPTSGWIEGATEILFSEYETARKAKVGQ